MQDILLTYSTGGAGSKRAGMTTGSNKGGYRSLWIICNAYYRPTNAKYMPSRTNCRYKRHISKSLECISQRNPSMHLTAIAHQDGCPPSLTLFMKRGVTPCCLISVHSHGGSPFGKLQVTFATLLYQMTVVMAVPHTFSPNQQQASDSKPLQLWLEG